ncbi:MAG: potassium channel family protein [Patescibacteria group bacterium]
MLIKRRRTFGSDLLIVSLFFFFLLSAATLFYYLAEGWSLVDSFYFSSTTLITIGHAELLPSSDLSKLFTVFLSFTGVSTFLALVTLVAGELLKEEKE